MLYQEIRQMSQLPPKSRWWGMVPKKRITAIWLESRKSLFAKKENLESKPENKRERKMRTARRTNQREIRSESGIYEGCSWYNAIGGLQVWFELKQQTPSWLNVAWLEIKTYLPNSKDQGKAVSEKALMSHHVFQSCFLLYALLKSRNVLMSPKASSAMKLKTRFCVATMKRKTNTADWTLMSKRSMPSRTSLSTSQ